MSSASVRQRWLITFVAVLTVNSLIGIGEHGKVTANDVVFGVGLGLSLASGVVFGRPWLDRRAQRQRASAIWPVVLLVVVVVVCFVGARLV